MINTKNWNFPKRRSIRYVDYDYSSAGVYFVTLVVHHHERLFGEIENGVMRLNQFGEIVRDEWFRTAELRPNIELDEDEFVVMPNHIHGIIWIVEKLINENKDFGTGDLQVDYLQNSRNGESIDGTGPARRARTRAQLPSINKNTSPTTGIFGHPIPNSLSTIVGAYKSAVTKRINLVRNTPGKTLWLRNYYEHIIETEREYFNIVNYIHDNPENWGSKDEFFR